MTAMRYILLAFFLITCPAAQSHPIADVVQTATPFLTASPSVRLTGMGGTGVAHPNSDALNFFYNPAMLGWSSQQTGFAQQTYLSRIPNPFSSDISSSAFAAQVGYNFSDKLSLPLSVGVGFMRQFTDLGTIDLVGAINNNLGRVRSLESGTTVGFGANLAFSAVNVSAGFSLKRIAAGLELVEGNNADLPRNLFNSVVAADFGVLTVIPIMKRLAILENLYVASDISLGYSVANVGEGLILGDRLSFEEADPLPRNARLGYALNARLSYTYSKTIFDLLQLAYTAEAQDELIERKVQSNLILRRSTTMQLFPSDIQLWNNVVRGKSSNRVNTYRGWRLNLFETVEFTRGSGSGLNVSLFYAGFQSGYTIQSAGLFKVLSEAVNPDNALLRFVLANLNIQYHRTTVDYSNFIRPNSSVPSPFVVDALSIHLTGLRF
jgi:hypothetical protein